MSVPDTPPPAAADGSANRASNWNVPNLITVVRILLAPVFVWMLLADAGHDGPLRWTAAVLFVLAIATDGVDGAIARRNNLVTDLGKLLDPIADKVLTGGALVSLSILNELPWWVTIVILVREIGITVYRFVVIRQGVIAASRGGKIKTIVQSVAISFALFPLWTIFGDWIFWVNGILMTAAVILTVVTGFDYLWQAYRGRKAKRAGA
ncbi:CDP-diacylglycerol--glycerol-3-phosphate 3-phosphatidyltransferase [Leifsonia shinshuensis]|uniref:CDP-diacylglycerol--glycerol-3-phosphate 3-phosphatidyltransferase n=1 Tax=Leifsonia shinshuensis TaxID=150026 RepID=A0A7G6Y5T5_9MICO|nr:CDP-diacylglycerol--glycerol-3-phosphate 3-phosphatidyltransferase [Leifsonia shinshuensis]QNE33850.1 CDP-diacylglycerol--glycerol-3-phosphate 3-phosphatidyltransferase [Leifsonia shinshuensis]